MEGGKGGEKGNGKLCPLPPDSGYATGPQPLCVAPFPKLRDPSNLRSVC